MESLKCFLTDNTILDLLFSVDMKLKILRKRRICVVCFDAASQVVFLLFIRVRPALKEPPLLNSREDRAFLMLLLNVRVE